MDIRWNYRAEVVTSLSEEKLQELRGVWSCTSDAIHGALINHLQLLEDKGLTGKMSENVYTEEAESLYKEANPQLQDHLLDCAGFNTAGTFRQEVFRMDMDLVLGTIIFDNYLQACIGDRLLPIPIERKCFQVY